MIQLKCNVCHVLLDVKNVNHLIIALNAILGTIYSPIQLIKTASVCRSAQKVMLQIYLLISAYHANKGVRGAQLLVLQAFVGLVRLAGTSVELDVSSHVLTDSI
jgi:hypothetical protein